MGIGWFDTCFPIAGFDSEAEPARQEPINSVVLRSKESGNRSALLAPGLLEQLQHQLLHLVGLGQRGYAGLFQDRVLGHVGHRRRNVGGHDLVLC